MLMDSEDSTRAELESLRREKDRLEAKERSTRSKMKRLLQALRAQENDQCVATPQEPDSTSDTTVTSERQQVGALHQQISALLRERRKLLQREKTRSEEMNALQAEMDALRSNNMQLSLVLQQQQQSLQDPATERLLEEERAKSAVLLEENAKLNRIAEELQTLLNHATDAFMHSMHLGPQSTEAETVETADGATHKLQNLPPAEQAYVLSEKLLQAKAENVTLRNSLATANSRAEELASAVTQQPAPQNTNGSDSTFTAAQATQFQLQNSVLFDLQNTLADLETLAHKPLATT